jgi:hypothetical protein
MHEGVSIMAARGSTVILAGRLRRGAVVLVLAIFAVTIASAQAANSTKPYAANVHRTLNTPGSFTLTVTNDPRAQQSLGSANFTAPSGLALGSVTSITNSGFNVTVAGNIVQFRAKSSATALGKGGTVSADVTATTTTQCFTSDPLSATWGVEAKQSNDFSGQPGNALNLAPGADLTPLGSFVFAPIETELTGGLHVPQIRTDHVAALTVTAKDTCGNVDADYTGGSFAAAAATPTRLDGATFAGPSFSGGTGTGTGSVTPAFVEAGDHITITDSVTGISGTSDPAFDVVETICAVPGTACFWQNKNKSISANSTVPGDSGGTASLGFGFRALTATCGAHALVGDGVDINPHNYTGNYQVTLTYSKSLTGNGPASAFQFCTSTDTVLWAALPTCSVAFPVDCIVSQKRVTGGALEFVLLLDPLDPWGGGFG